MARVSDADVKTILDTDIDTTPFINMAAVIVDEDLASSGLSETRLTEIERCLAAHFACSLDPRLTSEKIGDANNAYQTAKGQGLHMTAYGEQALMLDSTGTLANLEGLKAKLETLSSRVPSWQ